MTTDRSGERGPMGARWLITPVTPPKEMAAPNVEVGPVGSRAPLQQKVGPKGANLDQISPDVARAFPTIVETWRQEGGPTPVITSGNDGRHKQGSRHYTNEAIDLRCNNLPDEHCQRISDALSRSLGPGHASRAPHPAASGRLFLWTSDMTISTHANVPALTRERP